VTQAVLSTFDLTNLLSSLPPMVQSALAQTAVTFAGGALPEPMWRRATRLFTDPVLSQYGATEVGPVAYGDHSLLEKHPGAVGRLLPWVRMEAVDENDRPLPAGEQGILRTRAPGMTHRYLDDPAASVAAFRGGWFYPGDVGTVSLEGVVQVIGRSDDVMNIGGAKIAPVKLESLVAGTANIRDVAATAVQEPNGEQFVAVGIVADTPIDRESLAARCREVVPSQVPIYVLQMEAIPRNDSGKILRRELGARISTSRAKTRTVQ
jgi:acyl-coenzyme A synthetase/AMP-(fatty) acid ligase